MIVPLGQLFEIPPPVGAIILELDIRQNKFGPDLVVDVKIAQVGYRRFAALGFTLHLPEQLFETARKSRNIAQYAGFTLGLQGHPDCCEAFAILREGDGPADVYRPASLQISSGMPAAATMLWQKRAAKLLPGNVRTGNPMVIASAAVECAP